MVGSSEEALRLERLLAVLEAMPATTVSSLERSPVMIEHRIAAALAVSINEQRITLLVKSHKTLYPRDVTDMVEQFDHYRKSVEGKHQTFVPMVVSDFISPNAREILVAARVGFFDKGGSIFLADRHIYLYVDRPPIKRENKIYLSIFKGKRSMVAQAFLQPRWWSVSDMAYYLNISAGTVSHTMKSLEERGWIETQGKGPNKQRRLNDRRGMLDAWTSFETIQPPPVRQPYYVGGDPKRLLERLALTADRHGVRYGLSGVAAAQMYTPHLTASGALDVRVMPSLALIPLLTDLNARPVSEGSNLNIFETVSDHEFFDKRLIEDIHVLAPLRVYLDCLHGAGRAKDLAMHLRREKLSDNIAEI